MAVPQRWLHVLYIMVISHVRCHVSCLMAWQYSMQLPVASPWHLVKSRRVRACDGSFMAVPQRWLQVLYIMMSNHVMCHVSQTTRGSTFGSCMQLPPSTW